ncbi:MAG: hypothetical protein AUJ55_00515 [Proteobacteria bacterium CG1_02_64_396]|nr:MAG: hypothetical protein AUJ55_00515 [Proteobacteria bacterium CG1_02_64_396]
MTTPVWVDRDEIDRLEHTRVASLNGNVSDAVWNTERLKQGIYGQRQPDVHMVRAKLPGGSISPRQLRGLADIVEAEAIDEPLLHVTTRQDLQFHYIRPERLAPVLHKMGDLGLISREACGHTVRNVTTCALAGRCPRTRVDGHEVVSAVILHFLRHPLGQNLPRKFKIAVAGCESDCALAPINDVGLTPTEDGFFLAAAGGLGQAPKPAIPLGSLRDEEVYPAIEALLRIHHRHSDRERRARARLKFVVESMGSEAFQELYWEERENVAPFHSAQGGESWARRTPDLTAPVPGVSGWTKQIDGKWARGVALHKGDLTPAQARQLADLVSGLGLDEIVLTQAQNLVIVDVPEAHKGVIDEGVFGIEALIPADIGVCPGAATCRLGITRSRDLADSVADLPLGDLKVRISGCANGCGHHAIADFGLHGLARKRDGHSIPAYQIHVGGSASGTMVPGRSLPLVAAVHAREALSRLVAAYNIERREGESVRGWAERIGPETLEGLVAEFAPGEGELEGLLFDWGSFDRFSTKEVGKGECAAALVSMIGAHMGEAIYELGHAQTLAAKGSVAAIEFAHRGVVAAVRALLTLRGEEEGSWQFGEEEALAAFERGLQNTEMVRIHFTQLYAALRRAHRGEVEPFVAIAAKVIETVRRAVESRDGSDNLQPPPPPKVEAVAPETVLDLKGVGCPINFVKTKLRLEMMPAASKLTVLLDDGPPIENVPLSLEGEGHAIEVKEPFEDRWKIVVRKKG